MTEALSNLSQKFTQATVRTHPIRFIYKLEVVDKVEVT